MFLPGFLGVDIICLVIGITFDCIFGRQYLISNDPSEETLTVQIRRPLLYRLFCCCLLSKARDFKHYQYKDIAYVYNQMGCNGTGLTMILTNGRMFTTMITIPTPDAFNIAASINTIVMMKYPINRSMVPPPNYGGGQYYGNNRNRQVQVQNVTIPVFPNMIAQQQPAQYPVDSFPAQPSVPANEPQHIYQNSQQNQLYSAYQPPDTHEPIPEQLPSTSKPMD
ncbi:hypothetical protein BLNAU_1839 [Blattamonas nauphoetae]|uniref:Uncharacterized protein n=1 Tax=Blattamonas nauphoetae TaxID=2049346 RepID=A0ABQ9YI28_9EUKA|nr:hypothetical protein BLNAU_1839 [Blattamonas nauphoetae]